MVVLLASTGVSSFLAGLAGYLIAQGLGVPLPQPLASEVPQARYALFLADWWAHENAYTVGVVGGVGLCAWLWELRRWRQRSRLLAQRIPLDQPFPLLERGRRWWQRVVLWAWDGARPVSLKARIMAGVALLIFLWGTSDLVQAWVNRPGDDAFGYGIALLSWPVLIVLVWVPGTITLLMARQRRAMVLFWGCCLAAAVCGAFVLGVMAGSVGASVTEGFLLLDVGLVYGLWRLLLRPTQRRTSS